MVQLFHAAAREKVRAENDQGNQHDLHFPSLAALCLGGSTLCIASRRKLGAGTAEPNEQRGCIACCTRRAAFSSKFADGAPDPLFDFYASRNLAPAWSGRARRRRRRRCAGPDSEFAYRHAVACAMRIIPPPRTGGAAPPEAGPETVAFELSLMTDFDVHYAADVRLGRFKPGQHIPGCGIASPYVPVCRRPERRLEKPGDRALSFDLLPRQPEYRGLVNALANYRALQSRGGWSKVSSKGEAAPDGSNTRSQALLVRLAQEDFLRADNPNPPAGNVREEVMRFQLRNRLHADGSASA